MQSQQHLPAIPVLAHEVLQYSYHDACRARLQAAEDEAASVVASEVAGSEAGRLSVDDSVAAVGLEGEPSGTAPVAALPSEASGMLSEDLEGAAAGVAPVFEEGSAKLGTRGSANELAVTAVAAASEQAVLEGASPAAAGEGESASMVEPLMAKAMQLEAAASLEDGGAGAANAEEVG